MTDKKKKSSDTAVKETKTVNLALQGGGAHGAFTWGVLDRLLEEESLTIEGISATSAGAMNAALVSYGLIKGHKEARMLLDTFWRRVSENFMHSHPAMDKMLGKMAHIFSPASWIVDYTSHILSPYQFNLFDINPLRDILDDLVDFQVLRQHGTVKLFINATNVRTGKIKIFFLDEICRDMILASACLPSVFKAVEINGEHYWDGGYSGNPAIYPIFYKCHSTDTIIVQINPLNIEEVPTTAPDIMNRINEISFNSTLMREMRSIAFVSRLISEGSSDERNNFKNMHLHMIEAESIMNSLGRITKYNPDLDFLLHLKEIGRQAAEDWITKNYDKIGVESSIDIEAMFF